MIEVRMQMIEEGYCVTCYSKPLQKQKNKSQYEEAFQAYCKTLHPLWSTRISRTEAEGFFKDGYEATTLEKK